MRKGISTQIKEFNLKITFRRNASYYHGRKKQKNFLFLVTKEV